MRAAAATLRATPLLVALALAGAGPPAAAQPNAAAATEEFGPWLLTCGTDPMTDRASCRLIHRRPASPGSVGQAALALEVVDRGGTLVPAVTARDLTLDGAGRALLALAGTAQLRFPPNRLFEMPCALEAGRSVVCAPRPEDAARASAELPSATRALVRVLGPLDAGSSVLGSAATPPTTTEPTELPLSRTAEALARFRARAPDPGPAEGEGGGGLTLRDLLGRLYRLLGPS